MYALMLQVPDRSMFPWCGDHMGWGSGWIMGLFWLVLFGVIVAFVWKAVFPSSSQTRDISAEETLRRRYARGEIDDDTFRTMMAEISLRE
jgi:putative membrane protein